MSSTTAKGPKAGLRDRFPGYYPPSSEALQRFVLEGLVVLDTNALLDVYRFTDDSRVEYLQALRLVEDRLWVPHQTANEFLERRTTVIRSRRTERAAFDQALTDAVEKVAEVIRGYATRRGLSSDEADTITGLAHDAERDIVRKLDEVVDGGADLDPDGPPDSDPILQQITELIDEKIGLQPDHKHRAAREKEWEIRQAAKVPPGYKDSRKGDRSIGDFLVWYQTMEEAKRRRTMPVLMISNEQKPDWVRRDGTYIGPRPELVKEMQDHAGQDFHLVDVRTFLTLASEHLSARISEATVDEAARLGDASVSDLGTLEQQLSEFRSRARHAAIEAARAHERYQVLVNSVGPIMNALSSQELDRAADHVQRTRYAYTKAQADLDGFLQTISSPDD